MFIFETCLLRFTQHKLWVVCVSGCVRTVYWIQYLDHYGLLVMLVWYLQACL